MENSNNPNDFWQVKIDDEIYEADLTTLKQWIKEGRLKQTDKVKKGNLNWLEAIKVPLLRDVLAIDSIESPVNLVNPSNNPVNDIVSQIAQPLVAEKVLLAKCYQHPEIAPNLFCFKCLKGFCNSCLPTINNTSICPECQIFCHPYLEIIKQIRKQEDQKQPFGLEDFKVALLYPLQEYLSLLIYGIAIGISLLPSVYILIGPVVTIIFVFALVSQVIAQAESDGLNTKDLYTFDITEMNKNFSHQLLAAIIIFLTCLAPYLILQTFYLVQAKDLWVYFTNTVSLFNPKLTPLAILTIIWAVFFYPLALLTSHVTKSGLSILNPIIGLKIITRMKDIYLKAFLMYLGLALIVIGVIFTNGDRLSNISTSLPHLMLVGIPVLYLNLAIGGIFGRALYKCQNDPNFSLDDL